MSIIKQLMYKWFGISDMPCETCEILREQLHQSEAERRELLHRLLDKDNPEPSPVEKEEPIPIQPAYTPWRVRREMLEAEDRKQAQLIKQRSKEISELEKELGVDNAS